MMDFGIPLMALVISILSGLQGSNISIICIQLVCCIVLYLGVIRQNAKDGTTRGIIYKVGRKQLSNTGVGQNLKKFDSVKETTKKRIYKIKILAVKVEINDN